jgi:hypothetical protein
VGGRADWATGLLWRMYSWGLGWSGLRSRDANEWGTNTRMVLSQDDRRLCHELGEEEASIGVPVIVSPGGCFFQKQNRAFSRLAIPMFSGFQGCLLDRVDFAGLGQRHNNSVVPAMLRFHPGGPSWKTDWRGTGGRAAQKLLPARGRFELGRRWWPVQR